MSREIRKLIKKVDELQKQLNQQNESIMDQSIIIQKLTEKLVVIPTYPSTPSIDPHFGKDIPYVPYKGPDCTDNTKAANVQKVNMYGEVYPQYPFDTSKFGAQCSVHELECDKKTLIKENEKLTNLLNETIRLADIMSDEINKNWSEVSKLAVGKLNLIIKKSGWIRP